MNRLLSESSLHSQHRKSTSTYSVSSPTEHLDYLTGILRCPLCHDLAKQAHMCPACCKIFCELCINTWIGGTKQECPTCSKSIKLSTVIKCQALAKQIQQAISKTKLRSSTLSSLPDAQSPLSKAQTLELFSSPNLSTSRYQTSASSEPSILCSEHQLRMDYYCDKCNMSICSDCAVLGLQHQGHKVTKISQKLLRFREGVSALMQRIGEARTRALRIRDEAMERVDSGYRLEQEKKQLFAGYVKRISESLGIKFSEQVQKNQTILTAINQEYLMLVDKYSTIMKKIESEQRVNLVRNAVNYESQLQKLIDSQTQAPQHKKHPIENQIVPPFGTKTFILHNYSHLRQKGEVLFSEPLFWKGIEWRLKIFPGGTDPSAQQHQKFLAIYLEMSRGYRQPNIYKYQILLVSQSDRSKAVGCAFENQFCEGAYWGLDRFASIPFLHTENFVHPVHGYLEIVLNVGTPTYYYAVRNQDILIKDRKAAYKAGRQRLGRLVQEAGMRGLKISGGDASSWNVRALVDRDSPRGGGELKRVKSASTIELVAKVSRVQE